MSRRRAPGRRVNGILALDKPAGVTSNAALQQVKRLYQARKAGHTGSLDQLATGLLPLCFGEATKVSTYLLEADKVYAATLRLGANTTTGDAGGEVIRERPVPALDRASIEAVLDQFRGEIEQVPPMYSALKHHGRRLHELARAGLEVERAPRRVTIRSLTLKSFDGRQLAIEVACSKGTYIRTLAEDIGERLDCGAYVSALRRLQAGPFRSADMRTMQDLEQALATGGLAALDALLLPADAALADRPAIELDDILAHYVSQGQPVQVPRAPTSGQLRLYDDRRRFIGVGEVLDDGRIAPRRLLQGV